MDDPWTARATVAEQVEQAAWRDFYAAAPSDVTRSLGVRVVDIADGVALVAPGAKVPLLNRVLGLGTDRPITDRTVEDVKQLYATSGTDHAIHAVPVAAPARDPVWWRERGYRSRHRVAKFARTAVAVHSRPTELRVVRTDLRRAGAVADLICTQWPDPPLLRPWIVATVGRPGWRHYLAVTGRHPVAAAAMFTAPSGSWLGWAVTLPDYRGQGAHRALVARRVADAQVLGSPIVTVDTGVDHSDAPVPAHRTMMQLGFTLLYIRPALFPRSWNGR